MSHKLRAWDFKEKRMLYDSDLPAGVINDILEDDRYEFMLFTGKYDIYENELYENDMILLLTPECSCCSPKKIGIVYSIDFVNGMFTCSPYSFLREAGVFLTLPEGTNCAPLRLGEVTKPIEKVGNLFESYVDTYTRVKVVEERYKEKFARR